MRRRMKTRFQEHGGGTEDYNILAQHLLSINPRL
ncbi:unnamed protein product [Brassica oleracea]